MKDIHAVTLYFQNMLKESTLNMFKINTNKSFVNTQCKSFLFFDVS